MTSTSSHHVKSNSLIIERKRNRKNNKKISNPSIRISIIFKKKGSLFSLFRFNFFMIIPPKIKLCLAYLRIKTLNVSKTLNNINCFLLNDIPITYICKVFTFFSLADVL